MPAILLESGDFLLLEDGSSHLLEEGHAATLAPETVAVTESVTASLAQRTIKYIECFDAYGGSTTEFGRKWVRNSTGLSTLHAKTGTYSAGNASGTGFSRAISITGSKISVGFWYYPAVTSVPFVDLCILCSSGSGYDGFNGVAGLDINSSFQLIAFKGQNRGTARFTSAACVNQNAWNWIQFAMDCRTAGSVLVKCNGVDVIDGSADFGSAGGSTLAAIQFGVSSNLFYDSIYIAEGLRLFSSEQLVNAYLPNTGNGANTGLTPSTGTDHGALVDEASVNDDTDYNEGGAGVKDSYTFTPGLTGREIQSVVATLTVKASTAGTNTVAALARVGGADYAGTTQAITTSYDTYEQRWNGRPSDGALWQPSDIAEFGMDSIASAGTNRLTQIYIEVLNGGLTVTDISVSDAITITDNFSNRTVTALRPAPFETISLVDAVTTHLSTGALNRLVSDSITVAEAVALRYILRLKALVGDDVTLAEALTTRYATALRVLLLDALTVTEDVTDVFSLQQQLQVEAITIEEFLRVSLSPLVARVRDRITVKDFVFQPAVTKLTVNVRDLIHVTEGRFYTATQTDDGTETGVGPEPPPMANRNDYWEVGI